VVDVLFTLPEIPVAVLPDRTIRKTGRNAGIPPSRRKGTGRQAAGRRRRAAPRENGGIRKIVREEAETDDACGADLSGIGPFGRERRVQAGIVFEIVGSSVEAWTKERPGRGSRTVARSPDDIPGPLQYGNGL